MSSRSPLALAKPPSRT
jgi:hypothetical protein